MARLYTVASTSGAKAADAEYFASDLDPTPAGGGDGASRWTVTVSMLNDDIEITFDSGTTWVDLSSTDLTANTITEFTFNVRDGDTVNFRTNNVGGTTLDFFRVDAERT